MVNKVMESFKKMKNLSDLGIDNNDDLESIFQEYFNNGEIKEANTILDSAEIATAKVSLKSSAEVAHISYDDLNTIIECKLKFIKMGLEQKNIKIFHDMATEAYLSDNINFINTLMSLSYKSLPTENSRVITNDEAKISEFGNKILSSNYVKLDEKINFIIKVHNTNEKFAKDIISKFNMNNMHKNLSISQRIDFFEILSFYNEFAALGDPNNPYYNLTFKFPTDTAGVNYADLLNHSMHQTIKYKEEIKNLELNVEEYKIYKENYNIFNQHKDDEEFDIKTKIEELKADINIAKNKTHILEDSKATILYRSTDFTKVEEVEKGYNKEIATMLKDEKLSDYNEFDDDIEDFDQFNADVDFDTI